MTVADTRVERLRADEEARLDYLISEGHLVVHEDDSISVAESFEKARGVYADTYVGSDDEQFHRTVADLFDLSVEEAASSVDERDLTRWELATYLALRSELEADLPQDVELELAALLVAAGEATPVPPELPEVDDEESFLDDPGDTVLFVFARNCNPCEKMKAELDGIRATIPEGVTSLGADGGTVSAIRRAYGVEVAPTVLLFADGDLVNKLEGYTAPADLGEAIAAAY